MSESPYRIGSRALRVEDRRMLTGQGRFTDDSRGRDELHLVVVRSPHGHARILGIDIEAAAAAPGVVIVATAEDMVADRLNPVPSMMRPPGRDGRPAFLPPRMALARDMVRFVGEPVAAIVALSEAAARDAAELVVVDYDVREAVVEAAEALQPGAPQLWPELPGNEAFFVARGPAEAVEQAFAAAARVVRADFSISRVSANPIEPRGALATWSKGEGRFTLQIGTHAPHGARQTLASIFGISPDRMRIVAPDLGGSFGMREGSFPEYILALWAARRAGRPVRWLSDRSEALASDYHGRDNATKAELALDSEGRFLALRVRTLANMGAYVAPAGPISAVGHVGGLSGVYRTPAIRNEVTGVLTNTSPVAPYRGAGRPEATYVLERLIDIAARETGMDRIELRRRNLIPASAMPFQTGFVFTYDSGDFAGNVDKALQLADWSGFPARRRAAAARGLLAGIGLANSIELAGGGPPDKPFGETAEIRFLAGGEAAVLLGSKSHGQGHETTFTQLMVETFGLAPEAVRVVTGDTDQLATGGGSFGSRTTGAAGTALLEAARRVIEKGKRLAAHMMEAAPEDVEFDAAGFRVAGTDRTVTLAAVCALAHDHFRLPPGEDLGLSAQASVAPRSGTFPSGCHVCEVEIDPETGTVRILRYAMVGDAGVVINPALVDAQIHGGAVQGIGQALMEQVRYDADGQLLSGSFQDYAMPRADDVPFFDIGENPTPTAANPLGVKGVGETGTVGAIPAVCNAVMDALAPFGIVHLDMPLTPMTVWQAIRDSGVELTAALAALREA
jgi:carbon-monoxide dehydrogenase large subunit